MNNPTAPVPAQTHPWSTVFQLAKQTEDPTSWRLAGGLMVQLHAFMRGQESRATADADFLVDVLTHANGVRHVKNLLSDMGFVLEAGTLTKYTTRMRRGNDVVDLLVDNHLSPFLQPRSEINGLRLLGMPGSRKAVSRSMLVDLRNGDQAATICVPDLLGALLMKAASYRETSQFGRERHLADAMRLASLIDEPEEELARLDNRSPSDRRNVRTLKTMLLEGDDSEYSASLSLQEHDAAIATIRELSRLLEMPRRSGRTADFL
ncbi:hypothetical protein [Bifidobacterium simiiventris]|uniref:hypothetical protein n=1 Tax=Bifidobacterium simiiventris TaxID=2834434 RepID=UPI001C561260|nr:hypothetical protein [Bifidobacterium simiiventris]MBW3079672.1 hypothetical protein [Bifidobacterium simiiventris]